MKKLLLLTFLLGCMYEGFAQNPYPLVPIDSIQFVNAQKLATGDDSPDYMNATFGDTVQVEGIVTLDPQLYALSMNRKSIYLQRDGGAEWSGVEVMVSPTFNNNEPLQTLINDFKFYDNCKKGFKVRVTGIIRHFQNNSQLQIIRINKPNFSNEVELIDFNPTTVNPSVVPVSDLMQGNANTGVTQQKETGEKWEGVYIELQNVTVFSKVQGIAGNSNRWSWAVSDDNGNAIDIRDVSAYYRNDDNEAIVPKIDPNFEPPAIGTRLGHVRGVIVQNDVSGVARYSIALLDPSDLGPVLPSPPQVTNVKRDPVIADNTQPVTISARITDDGAVAGASVYYAVGFNNPTFTEVPMVEGSSDIYAATIPAQAAGSIVKYYIRAEDDGARVLFTPDSLASNSAYLVVGPDGVNSIRMIQETPFANGSSIWNGDTLNNISVGGIVTAANTSDDLGVIVIQSSDGGPYSGIVVRADAGDGIDDWKRGDSIIINSAIVTEDRGLTILVNAGGTNHSVESAGNALPAYINNISIDSIEAEVFDFTEPYEATLVNFDNVFVVDQNADDPSDFGEFVVNTDNTKTTGMRVDDLSREIPFDYNTDKTILLQPMNFIRGVMYFSFGNWKLEPRNYDDIDLSQGPDFMPPVITLNGMAVDSVAQNDTYNDPGATATDNKDGNLTASIVTSGSVDVATIGQYILSYVVEDAAGNKDSTARTVIVYEEVNTGIRDRAKLDVDVQVYPSPAKSTLHVQLLHSQLNDYTIDVLDVTGRVLSTKEVSNSTHETINVQALNNGIYFCRISNGGLSKTVRFAIAK